MGGSVLWADDDLSLKDGDCYFTFDEVFELVKHSGWRLPTLEEVAELDDIYKKVFYKPGVMSGLLKYAGVQVMLTMIKHLIG